MAIRTLYPPIMASTMPAFASNGKCYVYFNLSDISIGSEIQHIQLSVSRQDNNKNVVNSSDGILYRTWNPGFYNELKGQYFVIIYPEDIVGGWEPGTYYKIQLRVGSVNLYETFTKAISALKQSLDSIYYNYQELKEKENYIWDVKKQVLTNTLEQYQSKYKTAKDENLAIYNSEVANATYTKYGSYASTTYSSDPNAKPGWSGNTYTEVNIKHSHENRKNSYSTIEVIQTTYHYYSYRATDYEKLNAAKVKYDNNVIEIEKTYNDPDNGYIVRAQKDLTTEADKYNNELITYINNEAADKESSYQSYKHLYPEVFTAPTLVDWLETNDFDYNLNEWKKQNENSFSEWSTLTFVKSLDRPTVTVVNDKVAVSDYLIMQTETSNFPVFYGAYYSNAANNEPEDVYNFKLYEGKTAKPEALLEDSNWLQHNSQKDSELFELLDNLGYRYSMTSADKYVFQQFLEEGKTYTVSYQVKTKNLFETPIINYSFTVVNSFLNQITNLELVSTPDEENGLINLHLNGNGEPLIGNYVLVRSSEDTDFEKWEDIKYFNFLNKTIDSNYLLHQDFTIECGKGYKYGIQREDLSGLRSSVLPQSASNPTYCFFEYTYLYYDKAQLKLSLNTSISSFKTTILEQKQNTLGSKYPTILRNGQTKYKEFPIQATISFNMDDANLFFRKDKGNYYFNDELVITEKKMSSLQENSSTDLTKNNFFLEKIFRDKVNEFLQSEKYKLFKSPTEGNLVVAVTDVTFSPKAVLGRMIADVSFNVSEIDEFNLNVLNTFGVIDKGESKLLSSYNEKDKSFTQIGQFVGEIEGVYSYINKDNFALSEYNKNAPNILDLISANVSDILSNSEYSYNLRKLESLWIEVNDKLVNYRDRPYVTVLLGTLDTEGKIVEKEITLGVHKIYYIKDFGEDIVSIKLKMTENILINYTYSYSISQKIKNYNSSININDVLWDQLYGIFTDSTNVLYRYGYDPSNLEKYEYIYPILNNGTENVYNYSVYSTLDILEVMKNSIRNRIKDKYVNYNLVNFHKSNYNYNYWSTENDDFRHYFLSPIDISIEANFGTRLILNGKEIMIGPSGAYTITGLNSFSQITELKFIEPTYALINFKCNTMQTIMQ